MWTPLGGLNRVINQNVQKLLFFAVFALYIIASILKHFSLWRHQVLGWDGRVPVMQISKMWQKKYTNLSEMVISGAIFSESVLTESLLIFLILSVYIQKSLTCRKDFIITT